MHFSLEHWKVGCRHTEGSTGGGNGIDTASSEGVVVDLLISSTNKGDARGETFSKVENFDGSEFDNTLMMSNGANVMDGGLG